MFTLIYCKSLILSNVIIISLFQVRPFECIVYYFLCNGHIVVFYLLIIAMKINLIDLNVIRLQSLTNDVYRVSVCGGAQGVKITTQFLRKT